jgi:hypothetical protein
MKQGSGNSSHSAGKIEPRSTAVSPSAAGQIGIQTMNTQSNPLNIGRGFAAPAPVATTTHHCGSQGKHK